MNFVYQSPSIGGDAIVLCVGCEDGTLEAETTLDRIFGMHFWGFTYGIEEKTLGRLSERATRFAAMKAEAAGRCPNGVIELVEMFDPRARQLGLTWPTQP